jgi:GNAT superfamily N-acetyltransferase
MENKSQFIIRAAVPDDVPSILLLIKELAAFEKALSEVEVSVEELLQDGFSDQPSFFCLVAATEKEIVGIALYFYKYSSWKGKCLYLDDIVVTESYRRKGIGQMLFDEIVNIASLKRLRRLEWQVLEWNHPAIDFYKKNKARMDAEWVNCKLTNHDYCK